ncbi:MAG TPA: DUF3105 domain-containing protein [Candidatus Limnocylindrales bacterium]|nr:DUF3105 domain-containing protein [Candidatus Limnocylindrales bacterium]
MTPSPAPTPVPTNRLGFTNTILGNQHVAGNASVSYPFCPPTSGDHVNSVPRGPIPAQVYPATEVRTPTGWIHNLEHGYVAVLYRCPGGVIGGDGCPSQEEMNLMQQWYDTAPAPTVASCPKKVLVARFDEMATRFAVVAWGRSMLLDNFELDMAKTFAEQWMEHDAVPEANSC